MARTHDMGGRSTEEPLNLHENALADWEVAADAVAQALGARGIRSIDESRRAMEDMPAQDYLTLGYYERWGRGTEDIVDEKGSLATEHIDPRMAELEDT